MTTAVAHESRPARQSSTISERKSLPPLAKERKKPRRLGLGFSSITRGSGLLETGRASGGKRIRTGDCGVMEGLGAGVATSALELDVAGWCGHGLPLLAFPPREGSRILAAGCDLDELSTLLVAVPTPFWRFLRLRACRNESSAERFLSRCRGGGCLVGQGVWLVWAVSKARATLRWRWLRAGGRDAELLELLSRDRVEGGLLRRRIGSASGRRKPGVSSIGLLDERGERTDDARGRRLRYQNHAEPFALTGRRRLIRRHLHRRQPVDHRAAGSTGAANPSRRGTRKSRSDRPVRQAGDRAVRPLRQDPGE